MKYITFTQEEKAECFEKLSELFYERNFGQATKSEIEMLMFRFYLEKLIHTNENSDGTIDYNKCSDYKISHDLGITQQRVRSLKVKNHLAQPIDFPWQLSLANLLDSARHENGIISIPIPDPILRIEIENYLDERGQYSEPCLKGNLLRIRTEFFIELEMEVLKEDDKKKIEKELKKKIKESNKNNNVLSDKDVLETALKYYDIVNIITTILSVLSPGSAVWSALSKLMAFLRN